MTIWVYRRKKLGRFSLSIPMRRKLPQSWPEVSKKQALRFAYILMLSQHPFDQPIPLSLQFTILNAWLRVREEEFYKLTDLQITTLLEKMQNVFNDTWDPPSIKLKVGTQKLRLPRLLLEGETTEAFAVYEDYYQKILNDQESREDHLDIFCGYILRRKNQSVSTDHAEKMAKKLVKQRVIKKFYVYWWYYCQRQQLASKYKGAFGKGGPGKKGPDFTSVFGWWGLIYSIGQDGPFGTEAQVKETELHSFLMYLDFNSNRIKELEWNQQQNS